MATRERTTKKTRRETTTAPRPEGERNQRPALPPAHLSGAALYRAEKARRSAQLPTTTALEEARREFEQMLKESRPAGTGGRPKKVKPAANADAEIEIDESEHIDMPRVDDEL